MSQRSGSEPSAEPGIPGTQPGEGTLVAGPVEARLIALLREAGAFTTQLGLPDEDAARLLAARAAAVAREVGTLRAALTDAGVLAPGTEAEAAIDRLLVLLAAVSPLLPRVLVATHARQVAEAAAALHGGVVTTVAQAHRRLERAHLQALLRFEEAHDDLQAQMRAAAAIERLTSDLCGAERDERRRQLGGVVADLARRLADRRERLVAQRATSAVEWRELDAELQSSVDEVGTELDRLLD